ncbi:hypothetical protein O3P69_020486 [Scylla paramamosain]|uniref:Uncharacterized protein n=1 Tax=Scylla paramamosain TaxID=85552 RepID=A0AAW0TLB2_SCYPA
MDGANASYPWMSQLHSSNPFLIPLPPPQHLQLRELHSDSGNCVGVLPHEPDFSEYSTLDITCMQQDYYLAYALPNAQRCLHSGDKRGNM